MIRIHIAGFPVRVGNQLRQLCAWCGFALVDDDLSSIMVAPNADGSPGEPLSVWEMNALVAVDGNGKWTVPPDDGEKLPAQCCALATPKLRVIK